MLIYQAMDYGLKEEQERELSEVFEKLLSFMINAATSVEEEYLNDQEYFNKEISDVIVYRINFPRIIGTTIHFLTTFCYNFFALVF